MSTQTKNNNIDSSTSRVVQNVATLDVNNPIPIEYGNSDIFILKKGRRYIPFLEGNDLFAQLILEARLLSPTTLSCVNSKTDYCIGKGVTFLDTDEEPQFDEWAKSVNKAGDSFDEVVKEAISGYIGDGNSFTEIVRGKVGSTRFVKLYPLSFLDCRLSIPDDDDIPTHVIKSKAFRRSGYVSLKSGNNVELPIYTGERTKWYKSPSSGTEHAVIYLKNKMKGYDFYGMPSNIASLPQQILEYKSARFNLDNFENNLVIGGVIVLQGNLTQEEADALGKKIIYQHSGDGKRGRYAILSSQNGIENSKILKHEQQRDGDFIEFDKRIEEKIIFSNSWSKVLIDPVAAGLGGNSGKQIKEIFEVKYETVIKPMQKYVMDKLVYPVMEILDSWTGTKYYDRKIGLVTSPPLSFAGELDINSIMTKDEGRKVIGLHEIGDNTFIKTSSNNKDNVQD